MSYICCRICYKSILCTCHSGQTSRSLRLTKAPNQPDSLQSTAERLQGCLRTSSGRQGGPAVPVHTLWRQAVAVARWPIPLLSSDSCILPPSSIDHISSVIDTERPLIDSNTTCELHGSRPIRSEDHKAGPGNPRVSARQSCPHAAHDVIVHSLKLQRDKVRQYQKKVSTSSLFCALWGG